MVAAYIGSGECDNSSHNAYSIGWHADTDAAWLGDRVKNKQKRENGKSLVICFDPVAN